MLFPLIEVSWIYPVLIYEDINYLLDTFSASRKLKKIAAKQSRLIRRLVDKLINVAVGLNDLVNIMSSD